ncbi:ganglioside GM2 activator-like isoform X2 [Tetranychus urticae]|uniref:MD-2-related lipid-recognition domain-containing protein n=1 Tax=Tetranychus urticae TaxID=32264 RepID=T1KKT9_TETUR|nr:ganglioside GM2 activator-like isoform X2 [Tetranychus urticae]
MFQLIVFCLLPLFISCAINWEDCGNADRSFVFRKLNFKDQNLVIDGKSPIQTEVDFSLLDPVDKEVTLSAELRRYFNILGAEQSVKLPCINDVGSCSNNFCYLVQSYETVARTIATQLKVPFNCEMKSGRYSGNITYPVPLDGFRPLLSALSWAASGKYEFIVRWYLEGNEIGCLAVSADLQIDV